MIRKLCILSVVLSSTAFAGQTVAGPASAGPEISGKQVQSVDWRDRDRGPRFGVYIGEGPRRGGRCAAWRDECGDRWGYGTFRYDRCLARHDC